MGYSFLIKISLRFWIYLRNKSKLEQILSNNQLTVHDQFQTV